MASILACLLPSSSLTPPGALHSSCTTSASIPSPQEQTVGIYSLLFAGFLETPVADLKSDCGRIISSLMKMVAAVRICISLLLLLHSSRGQKSSDASVLSSLVTLLSVSPQSIVSFLLLALTVVMSGTVYLWILRYVCHGCCDPVAVGVESEALAVVV